MSKDCSTCGMDEPREWCWEARIDCPFSKPPRHLKLELLWDRIVDQEKRIKALENPTGSDGHGVIRGGITGWGL